MEQQLKDQLSHIRKGKYLMIYGYWGSARNHTIEQGELMDVNWDTDSVKLHNTVYDRDVNVDMAKAFRIDESRSGSGAQSSISAPDWRKNQDGDWFKGDRKYEGH